MADGEPLKQTEIPMVYRIFQRYGSLGVDAWLSAKRNEFPWDEYFHSSTYFLEMFNRFKNDTISFPEGKNFNER